MRVPGTARRSNQSILKEISPECFLEGLMLKLKLQYFGHLIRRADSFEKTLMLGKIEGRRRRGRQSMIQLDGITDSMDMLLLLLLLLSRFSCVRLCDPIHSSPPGSTIPGILQARTLEWVAIAFSAMDMSLSKLWEIVKDKEAWYAAVHGGRKKSDTTE